MIDFHSHILPAIDDGASGTETAMAMLMISADYGVDTIVATPHCYVHNDSSVEKFLSERFAAHNKLKNAISESDSAFPEIVLGAEVMLSKGLSKEKNLHSLCIENTDYMLLEMPYDNWNDDIFEEIYAITRLGIHPVLAHLDRFFSKEKYFDELLSLDVLVQINASSFADKTLRRKLSNLFSQDAIHTIGTDMHNITSRPPNLDMAYDIIKKKFGTIYADYLEHNARTILENKPVVPVKMPNFGFIKKLML